MAGKAGLGPAQSEAGVERRDGGVDGRRHDRHMRAAAVIGDDLVELEGITTPSRMQLHDGFYNQLS
jgi:hypothetical protein